MKHGVLMVPTCVVWQFAEERANTRGVLSPIPLLLLRICYTGEVHLCWL